MIQSSASQVAGVTGKCQLDLCLAKLNFLYQSGSFHSGYYTRACMLSRFSCVPLFATLWIVTCQAPLSTWFSRQEYWSGWPFPPPGNLPDPRLLPLLQWQAGSLPLVPPAKPEKGKERWNCLENELGVRNKYWCGEAHGTPFQYCCLENPMDGGVWRAAVHGVAEGRTRLSDFTFTFMH